MHVLKKRGPVAHSLFLEQILKTSEVSRSSSSAGITPSSNWSQIFAKSVQERASAVVQESKVLERPGLEWNWEHVGAILKWPGDSFMDSSTNRHFVRRVAEFLKPSNNGFAKLELRNQTTKTIAKTGCNLIEFLLKDNHVRATPAKSCH
jgi:hypothetical protein